MKYVLKVRDDKGNVIGIPAVQGDKGQDGKDGANGKDGKDGKDGKSAYELAANKGFEGTEAEWMAIHFRAFYVGTTAPDNSLGNDGDIYLKYSES